MAIGALIGLALAAAACGSSGSTSGATSINGTSAVQLLKQGEAAADAAGSMHFVDQSRQGHTVQSVVGAVSAPTAEETLTGGSAPLQVALISGVIYIRGSASVLQSALGLSSSVASANAGKWISIAPGDAPFSSLSQSLTVRQELNQYTPSTKKPVTVRSVTLHGHPAYELSGAPSASLTSGATGQSALFVSTQGDHLPLGGALDLKKGTQSLSEVAVFSNWGTPIKLTAPSGAVAYSSIAST